MSVYYNVDSAKSLKIIAERGPRYAVTLGMPGHRNNVWLVDTAEQAERIYNNALDEGIYLRATTSVFPPQESVNLAPLARARRDALQAAEEATSVLRAAVLREAEKGRAEAEIARQAGVDRMTVRKWLGKKS